MYLSSFGSIYSTSHYNPEKLYFFSLTQKENNYEGNSVRYSKLLKKNWYKPTGF